MYNIFNTYYTPKYKHELVEFIAKHYNKSRHVYSMLSIKQLYAIYYKIRERRSREHEYVKQEALY